MSLFLRDKQEKQKTSRQSCLQQIGCEAFLFGAQAKDSNRFGAKAIYGMMIDRVSLSIKNGWLDEYQACSEIVVGKGGKYDNFRATVSERIGEV